MTNREIIICRDADELSRKAAGQLVSLARQAVAAQGRFCIVLSGGSTPRALYSLLATGEFSEQLAWRQIHLFWGDERCVAPDHSESNFRMVKEALLDKIAIPGDNVHRMAGELAPPTAAAEYRIELKKFFRLAEGAWPRFDLILLGLGEDGHTASLFPGSPALDDAENLVATAYVEKLEAHRLTLTLPVINHAAAIAFLVAGSSKAAVVTKIFSSPNCRLPAARVAAVDGQLTWFMTADAAVT